MKWNLKTLNTAGSSTQKKQVDKRQQEQAGASNQERRRVGVPGGNLEVRRTLLLPPADVSVVDRRWLGARQPTSLLRRQRPLPLADCWLLISTHLLYWRTQFPSR